MTHQQHVIVLLGFVGFAVAYEGWSSECWSSDLGDGNCDIECYNARNNWDFGDCAGLCNAGCSASDIGDGHCDPWCMTAACNYDSGDCGVSACGHWTCDEADWGDSICDLECANDDCLFDDGDCLYLNCAQGCSADDVGDDSCDWECNTEECDFDLGDCNDMCSPGCVTSVDRGDGTCDTSCYTEACNWDNGDCDAALEGYCFFGCLETQVGDGTCQSGCYNELCNWDDADCNGTYCGGAAMCSLSNVGDLDCDPNCNIEECNYDGGDCNFTYVYVDAEFTDDSCTEDVITVSASYYSSPNTGYCWAADSTMNCRSENNGYCCITTDDFDSKVHAWFQEEPGWIATWANADCEGTPETIKYTTNAACTLIDNNLWGYFQWSDEQGVIVPWQCTDDTCGDCFVYPDGANFETYYTECRTDGYASSRANPSGFMSSNSSSVSSASGTDSLSVGSSVPYHLASALLVALAFSLF